MISLLEPLKMNQKSEYSFIQLQDFQMDKTTELVLKVYLVVNVIVGLYFGLTFTTHMVIGLITSVSYVVSFNFILVWLLIQFVPSIKQRINDNIKKRFGQGESSDKSDFIQKYIHKNRNVESH